MFIIFWDDQFFFYIYHRLSMKYLRVNRLGKK